MAASKTNTELDAVKQDLAQLKDDLGSLVSALAESAKSKAKDTGTAVRNKAEEGRDAIAELAERLRAESGNAADSIRDRVAHNPLTSLLAATGVGYLLAKVIDRG